MCNQQSQSVDADSCSCVPTRSQPKHWSNTGFEAGAGCCSCTGAGWGAEFASRNPITYATCSCVNGLSFSGSCTVRSAGAGCVCFGCFPCCRPHTRFIAPIPVCERLGIVGLKRLNHSGVWRIWTATDTTAKLRPIIIDRDGRRWAIALTSRQGGALCLMHFGLLHWCWLFNCFVACTAHHDCASLSEFPTKHLPPQNSSSAFRRTAFASSRFLNLPKCKSRLFTLI